MDLRERMRQMFKTGQVKSTELYKEDGYCSGLAAAGRAARSLISEVGLRAINTLRQWSMPSLWPT